jgi:hypothetical protein
MAWWNRSLSAARRKWAARQHGERRQATEAEIAQALGIRPGTVKSTAARGLAALARDLGGASMTRTEDRLTDALGAAASAIPEESLRPLVEPDPGRRQRHPGRPGWLAPVAAAAGIALVIGLAALAGRIAAGHADPAVARPAGMPRYYVEEGLGGGRPVIRSTVTGAVIGTVPVPASGNAPGYAIVSGADASGRFFVAAYSPADRGERLYQFRLTRAGRVTGFSALRGGRLADSQWAANTLAVSPDGSWVAVGMSFTGPNGPCGSPSQRACPRPRPDYLIAISTSTGARTVWRNEAGAPHRWFSVDSLSWTSNDRELVVLGEWCPTATSSESCGPGRVAEVRALDPAAGGGPVYSGRLLLRQSARFPYPVQALISPDGATITAVVLRVRVVGNSQISGSVPEDLSVQRFSVVAGQPLAVLYRRRLGDTSEVNGAPHFLALAQAASGRHLMLDIGLCAGHCTDGANGWIQDGRLVPLPPADSREADQAW